MRFPKDLRLVPVVLIATAALFTLKVLGIAFDGGYTLNEQPTEVSTVTTTATTATTSAAAARAQQSLAQDRFNFPTDVTGSVPAKKPEEPKPAAGPPKPADPKPGPNGTPVPLANSTDRPPSPAERALLERLQERRQELDARARELEIRESLIKASEKKMEGRLQELRDLEARASAASKKKEESSNASFKTIVTMYENMKAKDAAKVFDRLEMRVLAEIASLINPRRMSDILGQMSPEAAERLTVELANRANGVDQTTPNGELPKIEGRPNGT